MPQLANELCNERRKNHTVPFVALTETWLKSYVEDAQLEIPGYNLYRCDRRARVGGEVAFYSHEKLPITNVKTYDDKYCQVLICTSELQKTLLCVLYRPHECALLSFRNCLTFFDEHTSMYDEDYQFSLFGDFNLPTIGWSSNAIHPGGSSGSTESSHLLLDFISENLCAQVILQPTRADNILNLYISNSEDLVSHVSVSDTVLSDHRLVEIILSYNPCSFVPSSPPDFFSSSFRSLDFHKADFNSINEKLSSVYWDLLLDQCDDGEFPELFILTLLQICLICCTIKVVSKNRASAPV